MSSTQPRGFTLLVAVIVSSVIVSVGLALLDVTLKQVLLSSAASQSQYAFYNADSALECALYWDQQRGAFDYLSPLPGTSISCANRAITNYAQTSVSGVIRTTFMLACEDNAGSLGNVTIDKTATGKTTIYANGYNSCDSTDVRRIERGLKAEYGV